ncbi:MAG: hypothetical protein EPN72_01150 [Nevskiaceae bacterium]|nr:MAG: hypothetical protein EPN63_11900 [Nevskiaceae bacterium]TBR74662.1 MAG: hypothetical protein EPN72_01150 [Nevskiaceae bacterium]
MTTEHSEGGIGLSAGLYFIVLSLYSRQILCSLENALDLIQAQAFAVNHVIVFVSDDDFPAPAIFEKSADYRRNGSRPRRGTLQDVDEEPRSHWNMGLEHHFFMRDAMLAQQRQKWLPAFFE